MTDKEPGKLSLTATLLFGAGALFVGVGAVTLMNERAVLAWSSVSGRVVSSEVTSETSRETHSASGRSEIQTRYRADVEYAYSVAGAEYVGTRVSMADIDFPVEDSAAAIVARYPAGAPVDVFYDPADASASLLEHEAAGTGLQALGFGLLLVLVGGGLKIASRYQISVRPD